MDIITLDFETHYSDDYTLKKLTTEAYVRDPRFETLLLGVYAPGPVKGRPCQYDPLGAPIEGRRWVRGYEVPSFLESVDWSRTAILAHHAHFDGLILSHHYGVRPALWLDTLSMARLVHGNHLSVALSSLAAHYGLGTKAIDYASFKGRRWAEMTAAEQEALGQGCLQDVQLTWDLFRLLLRGFPLQELKVIDMTIRMFTEPRLQGDQALYERVRDEEWARKNERLLALGVSEADLQSADRFVALLEEEGVEVEMKQGKNGLIPAIAKTDDFMKGLLDDGDDRCAALAEARLDLRSTINETRAGRLAEMSARGPMPVYLGYCAAHTTRWGGGDKVNLQNLPRGNALRHGLSAPTGFQLAVVDLSQIECRVLNRVAGQQDVLDLFAAGVDVYAAQASATLGYAVTKETHPDLRFLFKTAELGCGYGMGATKFATTCKRGGQDIGQPQAQETVDGYRRNHPGVVRLWREGATMLRLLAAPATVPFVWRDVVEVTGIEGDVARIIGPNGTAMLYRVQWSVDEQRYLRRTRRGFVGIWGGGLVENLIQYLARLVMSQAMLRIERECGLTPVLTTHDEVVYVVPAAEGERYLGLVKRELVRQPSWLPPIPLDAEGTLSERYEK